MVKKKGASESTTKVQASPEREQVAAPTGATAKSKQGIDFPIVGIGASAGGLAAFEAFFANMPAATESGMAFVLVQHLDPDHKSMLTDLVRRYTQMQVYEVADGMETQPNCAYIIPPNKDMAFMHGQLHLMDRVASRGLRLPIDYFFRSLAQDRHERAICIVLSGTGTDGTLGLRAVKAEGGMAMVQEETLARGLSVDLDESAGALAPRVGNARERALDQLAARRAARGKIRGQSSNGPHLRWFLFPGNRAILAAALRARQGAPRGA